MGQFLNRDCACKTVCIVFLSQTAITGITYNTHGFLVKKMYCIRIVKYGPV